MREFYLKMCLAGRPPPRDSLEKLTALPRPPSRIKRDEHGREGREKREWEGREEEGRKAVFNLQAGWQGLTPSLDEDDLLSGGRKCWAGVRFSLTENVGQKMPEIVAYLRRTARICYRNSVRPSVCLSVRPSVTRVDQSKRIKLGSCNFHHTVAPSL